MRKVISIILLLILAFGIILSLTEIPFGLPKTKVGNYYINKGVKDTGALSMDISLPEGGFREERLLLPLIFCFIWDVGQKE